MRSHSVQAAERAAEQDAPASAAPHLDRFAILPIHPGAENWCVERAQGRMRPGSVLVHAPSTVFQAPGGGENQLVQTARHLEALGRTVRPFVTWADRIEEAKLLHLFGMSREGLELARVARARGVPVVLSPISWFEPRALAALAPNAALGALHVAKWALRLAAPGQPSWRRDLLRLATAILPNSDAEARQLVRLFHVEPSSIHVVPNGVEARFADGDPGLFRWKFDEGNFVLYVGRIEPRKNVLGLIRATQAAGLPLVVIGDVVPGFEAYGDACRRLGQGCVRWVGRLNHDDPLLASAYAAARVFALPSWFETPGLAALEAALAGCAIVITPSGCTREYFGESVQYARPDRPRSIARALEQAWEAGPNPWLINQIRLYYLWTAVARKTAEVYDQVAA
jgi:glycosyltransferase involved in cell wall biosynthesis